MLLALPVLVLGACGGGDSGDSESEGQQGGPAQSKAPEAPQLEIVRPAPRSSTRSERVKVEGTVSDGATVEVDGDRAKIEGPANDESRSRWSAEVAVDRGRNVIEVEATLDGQAARKELVVIRRAPKPRDDGSGDGSGDRDSADATPPGGSQGGSAGEEPSGNQRGSGGSQGGSGGSGGNQGGNAGIVPPDGNQGGQGGSGGNQGGSGGAGDQGGSGGSQGGGVGGGDQGGPPAAPPPGSP